MTSDPSTFETIALQGLIATHKVTCIALQGLPWFAFSARKRLISEIRNLSEEITCQLDNYRADRKKPSYVEKLPV